jgi:hypothetical protein
MTKLEKMQQQLADAERMAEIIQGECEACANAGAFIQLKSAQRRALSLDTRIHNLRCRIQKEMEA